MCITGDLGLTFVSSECAGFARVTIRMKAINMQSKGRFILSSLVGGVVVADPDIISADTPKSMKCSRM